VVIAIAAYGGVSQVARACTCLPDLRLVAPNAATHPQGAAFIVRSSCGGVPGSFSATVDGQTVRTIGQMMFDGGFTAFHAFTLDPMPATGSEVVLTTPCDALGDQPCDGVVERARYVIGPPDTEAPPPLLDVSVIVEEADVASDTACFDFAGQLEIIAKVELGDREPATLIEADLVRRGEVLQTHVIEVPAGGTVEKSFFADLVGELGDVCVAARTRDASGNVSERSEDCESLGGCGCTSDATAAPWICVLLAPWLRRRRG
jgi:hypothetical protein